jgi:hypothetical protein
MLQDSELRKSQMRELQFLSLEGELETLKLQTQEREDQVTGPDKGLKGPSEGLKGPNKGT